MSIQNLISEDIKKAMLAREVDKLAALRSVKAAILLEASKDGSSEVSDDIQNLREDIQKTKYY